MTEADRSFQVAQLPAMRPTLPLTAVLRLYLDVYILAAALFATFWFDVRGTPEVFSVGSAAVMADDFVTLGFMILVPFCIATRSRLPLMISIFMLIYAVALGRGIIASPAHAHLGYRTDSVFFALLLSVLTGSVERIGYRRVVKIFTGFALATATLSLLRNAFGFTLFAAEEWTTIPGIFYNDGRTLNAFSVLLMSMAIILRMCVRIETRAGEHRFRFDGVCLFLLLVIMASGQRTASIGLLLSIGFMLCNRFRWITYIAIPLIVLAFLLLAAANVPIDASLIEGAAGQYGKSGTFTYRTLIWTGFLHELGTWSNFDYLFGLPVGERPQYYLYAGKQARLWTGSIHSAYLGTIVNTGVIGAGTLMALCAWRTVVAYAGYVTYSSRGFRFSPELCLCFAMLFFVLGLSYEWRGLTGFIVGVMCNMMIQPAAAAARSKTTWHSPPSSGAELAVQSRTGGG